MSWVRERTTIDALNSTPLESPPSKGLCSVLTIPCKKKAFKSSTVSNSGFFQMPEKEFNTFDSSSLEGIEDWKGYLFLGLLVENLPDSSTVDQPTGKYIYTERPSWCATPPTPTTTGKIPPPSHESIWWIVPSSFGSWNSRQPVTLVYHYDYFPLFPPPYYLISD